MDFGLSLRETVDKYGLMAKKNLGQNFLLDQNITDKIIRLSLERQNLKNFAGRQVYEIGPGPGGLTRAILNALPQNLTVIEMDPRCIAIMQDLKEQSNAPLEIISGDALNFDFDNTSAPRQIVSNLPYNISVLLLTKWLHQADAFEALTLMFQKEVAERITAAVHTKSYGRLSVLTQLVCHTDKLLELNPECFVPAPKIYSTVLLLRPLPQLPTPRQLENVSRLTALAFGQRRKMIRQSLKSLSGLESACSQLSIKLTARAEEISPQQYLELAELLFSA